MILTVVFAELRPIIATKKNAYVFNFGSNTAVVGISSLGYDHTKLLGSTIEEIAWQKAGIMKPDCIAISAYNQPAPGLQVLQQRAIERKVS